MLQGDS